MHVFALSMHLVQFREVSSDISLRRDFKLRKCRKNQMSRVKIKPTELPRQLQWCGCTSKILVKMLNKEILDNSEIQLT